MNVNSGRGILLKKAFIVGIVSIACILDSSAGFTQYYRGGYTYEPYGEEFYEPDPYPRRVPRSRVEIIEEGPVIRTQRPKRQREPLAPQPPKKPDNIGVKTAPSPPAKPAVLASNPQYMPQEVVFEFKADASPQTIDEIIAANKLERIASWKFKLTNSIIFQYRITDGRSVEAVMAALHQNSDILSAQPNFVYNMQQPAPAKPLPQYILDAMRVSEAQKLSKGTGVIMSGFDKARAEITAIAPEAKILPEPTLEKQVSTSFQALRNLDSAFENKARIVNIGSANRQDKSVSRMIAAAKQQNMIMIGANGNADVIANTPYVNGVIALMLQLKPELNTDDVRKILAQSATTIKTLDGKELKLIDALAAVKAVEGK